jgi:hypothetical protein
MPHKLAAGAPRGAEASALLYSLIETARANNCEPYSYLRHIFTHLPSAQSLADYEALLPWNLDRAKIILSTRQEEEANYIFEKWLVGGTVGR